MTLPATVNALQAQGINPTVFGIQEDKSSRPIEFSSQTHVTEARSIPMPGLRFAPGLGGAIGQADLDLLHQHGLWLYPSLVTVSWKRRTKGKTVISPHGMLDPWALRNSGTKKRLAMWLYERANLETADCLHALNADECTAFRDLGFSGPIAIIPNGIDFSSPDGSEQAERFLKDEGRKVLLFLGRIHPKKGLKETIEAFSTLNANSAEMIGDWVFVIAGWDDGGHQAELERLVTAKGLTGKVRFVGPVFGADKERLLAQASAFVLASHSEGQPMSVLEAWAHGLPVAMTRKCNLPEGFAANAAAELPDDADGAAEALKRFLVSGNLEQLGANGRQLVEDRFTWTSTGKKLAEVYRWLTKGTALPDCVQMD